MGPDLLKVSGLLDDRGGTLQTVAVSVWGRGSVESMLTIR
jgi:hypothetical protein